VIRVYFVPLSQALKDRNQLEEVGGILSVSIFDLESSAIRSQLKGDGSLLPE
jgi:hypothetical protein